MSFKFFNKYAELLDAGQLFTIGIQLGTEGMTKFYER
jgi:hypothetical protein